MTMKTLNVNETLKAINTWWRRLVHKYNPKSKILGTIKKKKLSYRFKEGFYNCDPKPVTKSSLLSNTNPQLEKDIHHVGQ